MPPNERARRIVSRYSPRAHVYERLLAPELRRAARPLLERLALSSARRVLDVGCGVGALLPDLRAGSPSAVVVGVDRTEAMLRRAPRGFPLSVMDGGRLAVRDAALDVVVMAFMLFHLLDPAAALEEARRVLRPGGRVGVVTWGGDADYPAQSVLAEELDAHGAPPVESDLAKHELVDTPAKVAALLDGAGYDAVESWSERLDARYDRERFVESSIHLGGSSRRLEALAPQARDACLRRVEERLASLGAEDFVDPSPIVYAAATA